MTSLGCRIPKRAVGRARSPEQQIRDTAAEPYLAAAVVMLAADRLVENMRVVATQPVHLLTQPKVHTSHEVPVTLVPQLVAVREVADHPQAVGLDGVFTQRFGVERRNSRCQ